MRQARAHSSIWPNGTACGSWRIAPRHTGRAARIGSSAHYAAAIRHPEITLPVEQPWSRHTYHLYVVRTARRDALRQHLAGRGVGSQIHYPVPLHLQQAFAHLGQGPGDCPVAERCAGEILSLPLYPELTEEQVAYVAESVNVF